MRTLLSLLLLLSACGCRNENKEKAPDSAAPAPKPAIAQDVNTDVFFKMSDTSADIRFIDSFFVLVYNSRRALSIKEVQKYFPSNEEEIAFLKNHIGELNKRNRMEDSIYGNKETYKSKFFTSLSRVVKSDMPGRKDAITGFAGYDIIETPVGNSYDTSYVKYNTYAKGVKKMTFYMPYIRNGEYYIANIYRFDGPSLIDKACQ